MNQRMDIEGREDPHDVSEKEMDEFSDKLTLNTGP